MLLLSFNKTWYIHFGYPIGVAFHFFEIRRPCVEIGYFDQWLQYLIKKWMSICFPFGRALVNSAKQFKGNFPKRIIYAVKRAHLNLWNALTFNITARHAAGTFARDKVYGANFVSADDIAIRVHISCCFKLADSDIMRTERNWARCWMSCVAEL